MDSKTCLYCGETWDRPMRMALEQFSNRLYCSRKCYFAAKRETQPPRQMLPCRICGQPTRYHGTRKSHLYDMVRCNNPACIEQSRALKNSNIATRAKRDYQTAKRKKIRYAWRNVSRISPEELILAPWITSLGWISQHRVHTGTVPSVFHLDFGLPDKMLYVEIDGHVHRLRKERDARRDRLLQALGWVGIRIPARDVRTDVESVKSRILALTSSRST